LSRVLERLGEELRAAGDGYRFVRLAPFLTGQTSGEGYKSVAAQLEMTEAAVKVAVHRLRRRYGKLLRVEVARTVSDADQVDEEIRFLFSALSG
jgi:RNA polymerase sigma-70 factor (ECF subfamily)